jgi:[acyl-carrier-protein] S-malonyltransferase
VSKTALFFPGQASQYVGMGRDLYDASTKVQELYQLASDEIGVDIAKLSFEGPAEELKKTRFTQPAILLHSLAVLIHLEGRMPSFDSACGHSLGEYGALAATGALTFEDAVKAVVKRASLMEQACQDQPGTMAAVMGLDETQINEVCKQAAHKGVVVPANYNSNVQIAISGAVAAVEEAAQLAKDAGAKRAIILEVGGAFHSPLMEPARQGLEDYLSNIDVATPTQIVVANVTAEPVTDGANIKQLLVRQVTSPVKWSQTMSYLVANGVERIIEIGPGRVLSGLAKRDMQPKVSTSLDKLTDIEPITAATA